jgi:hypothetical protein
MRRQAVPFLCALSLVTACTGLVAGPESSAVTPVSASRDSAYVRAHRAMQAEAFTVYNSSNAQLGTSPACRVRLALDIQGNAESAQVSTTSRWLAPEPMLEQAPDVCEKERTDVLARVSQTIDPAVQ